MVTTSSSGSERPGRDTSSAMLLLTLLLVGAGVMVWYWTSDGAWTPARIESAAAPVAAPAAARGAADAAGPGGGSAATWGLRRSEFVTGTVYLVESQEQAAFLGSAWVESFATANGLSWGAYGVVVLEAGQDAALLFSEEQWTRAKEGLPALTIVDLRPAVGALPAGPDGTVPVEPSARGFVP